MGLTTPLLHLLPKLNFSSEQNCLVVHLKIHKKQMHDSYSRQVLSREQPDLGLQLQGPSFLRLGITHRKKQKKIITLMLWYYVITMQLLLHENITTHITTFSWCFQWLFALPNFNYSSWSATKSICAKCLVYKISPKTIPMFLRETLVETKHLLFHTQTFGALFFSLTWFYPFWGQGYKILLEMCRCASLSLKIGSV